MIQYCTAPINTIFIWSFQKYFIFWTKKLEFCFVWLEWFAVCNQLSAFLPESVETVDVVWLIAYQWRRWWRFSIFFFLLNIYHWLLIAHIIRLMNLNFNLKKKCSNIFICISYCYLEPFLTKSWLMSNHICCCQYFDFLLGSKMMFDVPLS